MHMLGRLISKIPIGFPTLHGFKESSMAEQMFRATMNVVTFPGIVRHLLEYFLKIMT